MDNQRRSERIRAPMKTSYRESSDQDEDMMEDDVSESSTASSSTASTTQELPTSRRVSCRSNKYSASLKEPTYDTLLKLEKQQNHNDSRKRSPSLDVSSSSSKKLRGGKKLAAKSHSSPRKHVTVDLCTSDMEESSDKGEEEEDDDDDDDASMGHKPSQENEEDLDDIKIQKIIACRKDTLENWKVQCDKMNTSEIDYGSRWFQEDKGLDSQTLEERYLVKWSELSYLHCSWETQKDLMEQVDNTKMHISTFLRKSHDGYLFDMDERGDGEYFDPMYQVVDRVLEVNLPEIDKRDSRFKKSNKQYFGEEDKWGLIFDKDHPDYEFGTGRQLLIKWGELPYSDLSYEFERDLILNQIEFDEQVRVFYTYSVKPDKESWQRDTRAGEKESRRLYKIFGDECRRSDTSTAIEDYTREIENTVFPNGGKLRDYQAEGVAWMLSNYMNRKNSILADEMGLGKTIQTAVFIHLLNTVFLNRGPFLIIVPLSTLPHWERAFASWTHLNTVVYRGNAEDRRTIREKEFAFPCDRPTKVGYNQSFLKACHHRSTPKWQRTWMVQVVLTTPDTFCVDDSTELNFIEWEALVVDEAHRLKSYTSKFGTKLRDDRLTFKHTLLLTGTPIQNNMTELWTLLNFVDAENFPASEKFMTDFGDLKTKEKVDELHETIRPYILRRLKEDVEKSVPLKEETLIEVELTVLQKQYYRALYEKNVQFLSRNSNKSKEIGPSLNNIAMQLRKCCNHPFLLEGVERKTRDSLGTQFVDSKPEADFLVQASGKLVLLDKLLPKLKEGGHRVLIFSQFKIMLDIIEDYLRLRSFKAERIDGSITGRERQKAIDRFQAQGSMESSFIMLLTTRAGGVGINLTAADTVIIYDSDFNPQNDLQAQARCHRIGQTKSVKVYRLLTRKSYEMQMFHMSSLKMGLDQAVLQGLESGNGMDAFAKDEVEKLLRCGAYDIFQEDKGGELDKELNNFMEEDIDTILERRTKTVIHDGPRADGETMAPVSTFSKASFKSCGAPGDMLKSADDIDIDDPDFWMKVVGPVKISSTETLSSSRRRAKLTSYKEHVSDDEDDAKDSRSDSDGSYSDATGESSRVSTNYGLNISTSYSNAFLCSIQREIAYKERRVWGGSLAENWDRNDVLSILKYLQRHGYRTDSSCTLPLLSKEYNAEELKRMMWGICLYIMLESTDDELRDFVGISGRSSTKSCDIDKSVSNPVSSITGQSRFQEKGSKDNDTDQDCGAETDETKMQMCKELSCSEKKPSMTFSSGNDSVLEQDELLLSRFLESSGWASQVCNDAISYARRVPPNYSRIGSKVYVRLIQSTLVEAFNDILWSHLESRGWLRETVNERTRFRFFDDTFEYVADVLDAIPMFHTDLASSIIPQVSSRYQELLEEGTRRLLDDTAVSLEPLNRMKLKQFLRKYAPPQLIEDRHQKTKVNFPPTIIDTLSYVFQANRLFTIASEDNNKSTEEALAELIIVRGKTATPRMDWTKLHDVHLVLAIIKHGWVDDNSVFELIAADSSFIWASRTELTSDLAIFKNRYASDIEAVRSRVLRFLNTEYQHIETLKGFGLKNILQAYDIQEDTSFHGAKRWVFEGTNTEVENLTSQKLLVKRAKAILGKNVSDRSAAPCFIEIDKHDRRNVFIIELLHAFIKLAKTQGDLGLTLLQYAIEDAETRPREFHMKAIAEKLREIIPNAKDLSASKKNYVRAILGMEEMVPKRSNNERSTVLKPLDFNDRHHGPSHSNKISENNSTITYISQSGIRTLQTGAIDSRDKDDTDRRKQSESTVMDKDISTASHLLTLRMTATSTLSRESAVKNSTSALHLSNDDLLLLAILSSRGLPLHSCTYDAQSRSKFFLTWSNVTQALFHAKEKYCSSSLPEIIEVKSSNDIGLKVIYLIHSMLAIINNATPEVDWISSQMMLWLNDFKSAGSTVDATTGEGSAMKELSTLDCQSILDQIIQQTILREIFLYHDDDFIFKLLEKSYQAPSKWPYPWSCEDDVFLLKDTLQFGYSLFPNIREAIESRKSMVKSKEGLEKDEIISCSHVQDRVNLITKTLFEYSLTERNNSTSLIDLSRDVSDDCEYITID